MLRFGQQLAQVCQAGSVIYLHGTLGMGKTTLCRAVIQGLGWAGRVKSPPQFSDFVCSFKLHLGLRVP